MEVVRKGVSAKDAKLALFDFDGTISLIRAGWVDVMVPMMVEILADLKPARRKPHCARWWRISWRALTGEQTIYQMMELARRWSCAAANPCPARLQADVS